MVGLTVLSSAGRFVTCCQFFYLSVNYQLIEGGAGEAISSKWRDPCMSIFEIGTRARAVGPAGSDMPYPASPSCFALTLLPIATQRLLYILIVKPKY